MSSKTEIKIIDKSNSKNEEFYCRMCNYPLVSREDFQLNSEYFCCNDCYLTFVEARKKEWKNGWRPKQNLIDTYIKNKHRLNEKGDKNEF